MNLLRVLAAAVLLCAPLQALAQTAYGTSDLARNQCVVDVAGTGPNGQTSIKVPCSTSINSAGIPDATTTQTAVKMTVQACTASAVALPSKAYSNGFVIKALPGNSGSINVGGLTTEAPTASVGYPLAAGEAISYGAANSSMVSIICATGGSGSVAVTGN